VDLAGFAAALSRAADELEDHAALDACDDVAAEFLDELHGNTPVLTGALRSSEWRDSLTGSGESATAVVSTHLPLYAAFREHGGTIRAHDRPRGGWTGEPTGTFPRRWGIHQHTLHWPGGPFPLEVHQAGSWYMERTVDEMNSGTADDIARNSVLEIIRDALG